MLMPCRNLKIVETETNYLSQAKLQRKAVFMLLVCNGTPKLKRNGSTVIKQPETYGKYSLYIVLIEQ
jgi:hypothetical protein